MHVYTHSVSCVPLPNRVPVPGGAEKHTKTALIWYVNNAKLHSYLEFEWLTCILACAEYHAESRHLYTYIYIRTVVGSCISTGVSLWC